MDVEVKKVDCLQLNFHFQNTVPMKESENCRKNELW